jgi:hypothetical protein
MRWRHGNPALPLDRRHVRRDPANGIWLRLRLAGYRTNTGTTLMLLNGEPLISFVLTTV